MVEAMWPLLAGVILAAIGAYRFVAGYPKPPIALRALSPREYATIAAAALATYPRGGAIEPSGIDAGIPAHVDRFVAAQPEGTRRLVRLLLILIEHATLLFPAPGSGGRRRFSALEPEQQVDYLQGWQHSSLLPRRLAFVSLRAILTMGYFADPVVLRALGLAPRAIDTPVCEADLLWPPVGAPPSAIRFRASVVVRPTLDSPLGVAGQLHRDYEARGQ